MTNPRKALTDYERSLRMSNNQKQKQSGGITFAGALGLLFIGLKLGHVIDWPWVWVLAPFWAGLALVVALIVVLALGAAVASAVRGSKR
jgi:hypothetical protein